MSEDCKSAIEVRERLIYESDYFAGYQIHKKCRKTFHQFGCDASLETNLQMNREFRKFHQKLFTYLGQCTCV